LKPATSQLKPTAPQVLLILAALLAPIFGGYVLGDQTAADPSSLLTAMGEGQAPILQHALLALPVFLALSLLLLSRRIQQIPHPTVAMALMLAVAGLAPSVAVSSFRAVSVNVWMEWVAFAVAFLACVSGLGRRLGPIALLAAVFAGTAWIARIGLLEYLGNRGIDPTWRIFCNWNNPNAAAAMLVLGFFCSLALPKAQERTAHLLLNLASVVGGGLVLGALFLTGSKGGALLALPTGLVVFGLVAGRRHPAVFPVAILVLALSAVGFLKAMPALGIGAALAFAGVTLWPQKLPIARLGAAFAFAAIILAFFSATTPGATKTTGASRMAAASDTQDQSSTFRLNLWKSAATLTKERPAFGWGLGSYRYESARPGIATATVFSHNSYLQLAAEAGVGAVLLFLAFLGLWARRSLRGSSRLPEGQRLAFAAAVAGVAAILAHCLVDSDLSYFGLGLSFFLVLGAATLLAADAVAPEFIPVPSRTVAAGGVAFAWLLFGYLAWCDLAKSEVRFAQAARQPANVSSIQGIAGWDGDAAYLLALSQPVEQAENATRQAFALQPTPKVARYLARILEAKGDYVGAELALLPALSSDPNNLPALSLMLKLQQEAQTPDKAIQTARRLVAVEEKPYFKIRSLDQLVPTETYAARLYLAANEANPSAKASLLAEAVAGFEKYARLTVPEVVRASKVQPPTSYAGETLVSAKEKLGQAVTAATEAVALYRTLGKADEAAKMDEAKAELSRAMPE